MENQTEKRELIDAIKEIIYEHGSFTIADVKAEQSPMVDSLGGVVFAFAEQFDEDSVEVSVYIQETEEAQYTLKYEDLSIYALNEILLLAQNFEADSIQTEKINNIVSKFGGLVFIPYLWVII